MTDTYLNLPPGSNPSNTMIKAFDAYTKRSFELETGTFNSMKGFFQSKGFDLVAAESLSVIIIKQAINDGYKPMQILDTLKGLTSVELSALVAEIINYNRFKTSFLGYAREYNTPDDIIRNILP